MKSWDVNFTVLVTVFVLAMIIPYSLGASRRIIELRSSKLDGPPMRPEQFESVNELNQYLADLAEYYKMMGRPRFGKRSSSMDHESAEYERRPGYTNLWDVLMENNNAKIR